MKDFSDGMSKADIEIRPHQLLSTVCTLGGVECPLLSRERVNYILDLLRDNQTLRIRLVSNVDEIPHFRAMKPEDYKKMDKQEVFNRKRDLDVLQRLGLAPGDTRRARYLYSLLFQQIKTPQGICAYDTPQWEGCPHASSGAYEKIRAKSWPAVMNPRSDEDRQQYRERSTEQIENGDRLYIRPHHFMCMSCFYSGGSGNSPRSNDTIYEAMKRIQADPDVEIVLVEGCCSLCDCCDGYDPKTDRCTHDGGLIRDYKKDLDVFQKLGLMPGDVMKARDFLDMLFKKIPSTLNVCGYEDGIVTAREWRICGGPEGNSGYAKTVKTGIIPKEEKPEK